MDLSDFDPADTALFEGGKELAHQELLKLTKELDTLQELLYAEHRHKVLVVLQAMDTGGKDGTIRRVFEGVNPQGVRVASFKVPTLLKWIMIICGASIKPCPAVGKWLSSTAAIMKTCWWCACMNWFRPKIWKRRYKQINAFEKMLSEEGTTILKFFLHISPDEQKQRLLDRLKDETKQWKFNPG